MSPTLAPDDLVLTLAVDNWYLHAGTVEETIRHAARHRDDRGRSRPVGFYDAGGARLEPLVGHDLVVTGFRRAGGRAAPAIVRRRINTVLDRAQARLSSERGAEEAVGLQVPRPEGTLAEVIEQLRDATREHPARHAAGWFHNLLHALGM